MINNDTAKSTYTVTDEVVEYPIGFQYTTNPDGTPNLRLWDGDGVELEYGTDYKLSDDGLSIVLLAEIAEGVTLNVAVDEPFVQDSDYVVGRIDPEQIERDFDKTVLRDLQLRDYADDINDRLADEAQAREDADTALQTAINAKQDIIIDLANIRSGAAAGATAVQPSDLATVATTGSYDDLSNKPKYAASIRLSIDPSTFVVTAQLKDQDNNNIGAAQTIDLPLESVVVSGAYDSVTKEVVLTLENGSTVRFSVADLVSGLQTEITSVNMLNADLVDDTTSAHKFVTAADKTSWDNKVSKNGDTVNGNYFFSENSYIGKKQNGQEIVIGYKLNGSDYLYENLVFRTDAISFALYPTGSSSTLGKSGNKWKSVYVQKINNGADIAVPATGGTMARIEDLPDTSHMVTDNTAQNVSAVKTFTAANPDATTAQTIVANYAVKFGTSGNNDLFSISADTNTNTLSIVGDNASNIIDIAASGAVLNHFQVSSSDVTFGGNSLINPDVMTGADGTNAGTSGLVPAPAATDNNKFLAGDGTWKAAGGSSLPSQTGQSGKFLTTDGTNASWDSSKLILNGAKYVSTPIDAIVINNYNLTGGTYYSSSNLKDQSILIGGNSNGYPESKGSGAICVGWGTKAGQNAISIGYAATSQATGAIQIGEGNQSTGNYSISIGYKAACDAQAIQLVMGNSNGYRRVNSDANTFKVANANGNFEIMSADGTVPHGRLTKAVVSNTVTIAVADWNGGTTCTKTISGLTATSVVWVAPDNASQSDYLTAGVYASAQTTDTITFTATTTPTSVLTVNVIYC